MSSLFPSSVADQGISFSSCLAGGKVDSVSTTSEQERELESKLRNNKVTSLHLKSSLVYSKTLDYIIPIFGRLRELKMDGLLLIDEHISFFVRSLPLLELIEAKRMFNLWRPQIMTSVNSSCSSSCFIKTIKFINCPRLNGLKNIPSSTELIDLSGSSIDGKHFHTLLESMKETSLKSLIVQRCRKLRHTVDPQQQQQQQQQDKTIEKWLYVRNLPNLIHLDTRYCQNIEHIMVNNCPQLRKLNITYCYKLESIMIEKTNICKLDLYMLGSLHTLKISGCGAMTHLNVQGCVQLKNIFGGAFADKDDDDDDDDDNYNDNDNDNDNSGNRIDEDIFHQLDMTEIQCSSLRTIRWIDGSKKRLC